MLMRVIYQYPTPTDACRLVVYACPLQLLVVHLVEGLTPLAYCNAFPWGKRHVEFCLMSRHDVTLDVMAEVARTGETSEFREADRRM